VDEEVRGGIQISYVDHLNDVVDIVFPTVKRTGSDTPEKETLRGSVVQPTQNGKRPLPRRAPAKGKQPVRRSTDASA
jgi:hypothetical protein